MSTPPSAPAAMRARFSIAARPSSPSTATRRPFAPARRSRLHPAAGCGSRKRASASSTRSPRGLGVEAADGVVLDVGVSSMQLDEAARGFSLRFDAPLDMRMGRSGRSAADILREDDVETIADILFHFGEERAARRIARAIVADRTAKPFTSTLDLAGLIARVAPARRGEMTHPATRAFQALRIAVNDELGELVRGLAAAERLLKPGGRLAVVTFHSLEDRIVKQFFVSPLGPRARGLAPTAGRAGRSPADIRGAAPASRSSRAKPKRSPIRARARRSCVSACAPARRRGQSTKLSRRWPDCRRDGGEEPDVAFHARGRDRGADRFGGLCLRRQISDDLRLRAAGEDAPPHRQGEERDQSPAGGIRPSCPA